MRIYDIEIQPPHLSKFNSPTRRIFVEPSQKRSSSAISKRFRRPEAQTFARIREGDCYCVDKTGITLQVTDEDNYYPLSRQRRFSNSLLIDTLTEPSKVTSRHVVACGARAAGLGPAVSGDQP